MERRQVGEIDNARVNSLIFSLLMIGQVNGVMVDELEDAFKDVGQGINLYKYDIKRCVGMLRKEMEKAPKINWGYFDLELQKKSADMQEAMVHFLKSTIGIDNGYGIIQFTKYRVGNTIKVGEDSGVIEQVMIDSIIKEKTHSEVICYKVRMQTGEKQGKLIKVME